MTKKIKYKTDKYDMLITLCKIKEKHGWYVGCAFCETKCENFISHDKEKQEIECKEVKLIQ